MTAIRQDGIRSEWLVVTALLIVNLLNFMDRLLPSILAEAIKHDIGLSDTQLALLTGLAFVGCYSLTSLPLARLSDRWSAKWTLTLAAAFWSFMTVAGGAASSFTQLALSRAGVAVGEAATAPAAHTIIQRTCRPGRAGFALAVFQVGVPLGTMLGMGLGGWLASVVSWRTVLVIVGLSGLGAVVLLAIVIPDARGTGPDRTPTGDAKYCAVVRLLFRAPAYRCLLTAMCFTGASIIPFMIFIVPFLIRFQSLSTVVIGLTMGAILGVTGIGGTMAGGVLFDREIARPRRGLVFWPAIALLIAVPATAVALLVTDPFWAIALLVPLGVASSLYLPATFGAAHLVAGAGNHATASSFLILASGAVGGLVGPLAVGLLSDHLALSIGTESLRYAMFVIPAMALFAAASFFVANNKLARPSASQA